MNAAELTQKPKLQMSTALGLAWHDFLHEWQISVCLILALAAVLTPLLVLFGLKSGIVSTLSERLKADPRNLEVKVIGNGHFDAAWVATLDGRADTSFVIAKTRSLAATAVFFGANRASVSGVELVPSKQADPLLGATVIGPQGSGVYLSHTLAGKLTAQVGSTVKIMINRRLDGQPQAVRQDLSVLGILSEATYNRDAAFISLGLLMAVENYKDGRAVEAYGWSGAAGADAARAFAGVRLYARTLDQVQSLADYLRDQGLEVHTRAKEIETVRAIDRVLSSLFAVIAGIGITGYALSLAVSLWANVDRKRKDLSLMRLLGYSRAGVVLFPLGQGVLVAACGVTMSIGLYKIVEYYLNVTLSQNLSGEELVCRLSGDVYGVTFALTMGLALLASAIGGGRAARIDPAESLREV